MTLDESTNWSHAAALERGVLPEVTAATRVAALIGKHVPYDSECVQSLAGKVVANRVALRQILDALDADPARLGERVTVLRQQQAASLDEVDQILEEAHWHKECWRYLSALAEGLRREQVAEHDVDARGADEDDRRISTERRDDAAAAQAPKVAS